MGTAVFLIVFVAFVARVVLSAAAIRNAVFAVALGIVAIGGYVALNLWLFSVGDAILDLVHVARMPTIIVLDALMLAGGYGIPTLLLNAETKGRAARIAAFFAGVIASMAAADVWRTTGGLGITFFLSPAFWFEIGVACFLIFRARFFEDVLSAH